jgi:DNA-binding response OmpR family regulator
MPIGADQDYWTRLADQPIRAIAEEAPTRNHGPMATTQPVNAVTESSVRRVVVADDDEDIVDLLRLNLEAAGYEVSAVYNGVDARDLTVETLPDLVVLDVMMPKMDGLQVLSALKSDPNTKDIPVVMLTAKASDNDVWQGWEAGADYYITKPFDLEELLRFISYLQVNGHVPQ